MHLADREISMDAYNQYFIEGEEPLENVTKDQMINGTNEYFLQIERNNAAEAYEA